MLWVNETGAGRRPVRRTRVSLGIRRGRAQRAIRPVSLSGQDTRDNYDADMLDDLLSPAARELYRRLVGGEYHMLSTGAAGPGLDPVEGELVAAGFARVQAGEPVLLVPTAPAAVAQRVLGDLNDRLAAWQDQTASTVRQLVDLQRAATGPASGSLNAPAEVVTEPDRIIELVDAIQLGARHELLSLDTTAAAGSACQPRLSPAIDDPPTEWKTVFTADFMTPDLTWIVDGTVAKGGQVRVAASLPMKLLVADRAHALVPLDVSGSAGVVSVRSETVIGALVDLFETLWDRATSYPPGRDHPSGLTPYELQVVSLLAAGCKDEEIAARTHVSIRTVRRSVAVVFDRLGVRTRFAAGVQAAKRQWI